jgi:hypothetical protein
MDRFGKGCAFTRAEDIMTVPKNRASIRLNPRIRY